jgi:ribosomal protein S18 acetylase RimI-like enzyme
MLYKAIGVVVFLISIITISVLFMRIKSGATIEWYEVKPHMRPPMFEQLQTVAAQAFVAVIKPYIYATDQRLARTPAEKQALVEQKIVEAIAQVQQEELSKKLDTNDTHYLAIAKAGQQKIIGFALFREIRDKAELARNLKKLVAGSLESITVFSGDEIYLDLLAVMPGTQKKGIGKALVFSVFDHMPRIKKIYLRTSASPYNKNTQAFYEHIGFTRLFTGEFAEEKGHSGFDHEKIVYFFQKKE